MVCPVCIAIGPHDYQPSACKGGTWCDCQHRLPIEINKQMNEESTTSNKLIDTEAGKNV